MKKFVRLMLVSGLSLGLALSLTGLAYSHDTNEKSMQHEMMEKQGMMGDGGMIMMVLDKKDKLGLTTDQIAKLTALSDSEKANKQSLFTKSTNDMKALEIKFDAGAKDAELKPLLDNLQADQQNMMASRNKIQDRIRAILTPTQQAKMVISMNKHMKHMMMKHERDHDKMKKDQKDHDEDE